VTTLDREVKAAYAGFAKWIGILLAGASLFSWAVKALSLPLSDLGGEFLAAYRTIFHPLIELLFGWLVLLIRLDLPDWWRDAALLYCVIGGAVARTYWGFYQGVSVSSYAGGPPVFGRVRGALRRACALAASFIVWPIALLLLLASPFVFVSFAYWKDGTDSSLIVTRSSPRPRPRDHTADPDLDESYQYSLLTVFALQLLAVAGVFLAITLTNGALS
jgi:hypothetical protein